MNSPTEAKKSIGPMLAVFLIIGGGFLVWFGAWSLIPTLQGFGFNYPC
jgi:hypothetical protein